MSGVSVKFYKTDEILSTVKIFTSLKLEGALIFDDSENLVGVVTEGELLKGVSEAKSFLNDVMVDAGVSIYEDDELKSVVQINQVIYPVKDQEDILTGFLLRNDLLERFSAEASVNLSHLDAIFDSAHNGILSIDKKGFVTSLNPAAEKMAGVTKSYAIGRFITDVVSPKGLLNVLRTGETASEKYQVGNRKYITNRAPILKDGEIVGAVGVFQDISEIEFVSDELNTVKKLLAELNTVIESSNDGVLILDRYGKIMKANQAFRQIIGIENPPCYYQELLGDYVEQCVVTSVVEKNEKVTFLDRTKQKNNQLMITATPIDDNNLDEYKIVVTVRDISELDNLRIELEKTKQHLIKLIRNKRSNREFIAHSPGMRELMSSIEQIASVDSTVLILGESGVGKEEISNLIHENSHRCSQPFVKVNCGAIPESLVDSELFGYESGAFTGAKKGGKLGYFERAHGGTIFLDEIGELPLSIQVKLLRVLQEKEIARVGGSKPIKIDVRVITATNKDLLRLVEEKKFRKDLYYRLNVIPILIPSLRERVEDIPLLIKLFQERICFKYGINKTFSDGAVQILTQYQWPGNVRELVNMVERLVVTMNRPIVEKEDVMELVNQQQVKSESGRIVYVNGIVPLKEAVDEVEKQLIQKAMKLYKNTRNSAKALKINQSTVVRKMKKFSKDQDSIEQLKL
jgi:PAS domain S-box-containing protein